VLFYQKVISYLEARENLFCFPVFCMIVHYSMNPAKPWSVFPFCFFLMKSTMLIKNLTVKITFIILWRIIWISYRLISSSPILTCTNIRNNGPQVSIFYVG